MPTHTRNKSYRSRRVSNSRSEPPKTTEPSCDKKMEKSITELFDLVNSMKEDLKDIKSNSVTKTDLKDINEKIGAIDNKIEDAISNASQAVQVAEDAKKCVEKSELDVQKLQNELAQVTCDRDEAQKKMSQVNERMNKLESYMRRENLLFEGIEETKNENCKDVLIKIFRDKLNIENAEKMQIHRSHRLEFNKKVNPIFCRFASFDDRQAVWKARRNLKGSGIFINEDFPAEYVQRRRSLYPIMKAARDSKKLAYFKEDVLWIDKKAYTVDSVDNLPNELHPSTLSTKSSDEIIAFFTAACPLSNFYRTDLLIDGKSFSSTEQYLQWHKAYVAKKPDIMEEIMKTVTPLQAKSLGDKITLSNDIWLPEAESALLHACKVKFTSNQVARDFLLGTNNKLIIEASKNKVWGVGKTLSDKTILEKDWEGENLCGKILMQVRDSLGDL